MSQEIKKERIKKRIINFTYLLKKKRKRILIRAVERQTAIGFSDGRQK